MRDPNDPCLFCNSKESGIIIKNHLAYASYDTYPVSKYHCLIIPKRHMKNFFDLTNEELVACNDLIKAVKKDILNKMNTYNFKNYFSGSKSFYNSEKTQFYNVILGLIFTIIFFATIT